MSKKLFVPNFKTTLFVGLFFFLLSCHSKASTGCETFLNDHKECWISTPSHKPAADALFAPAVPASALSFETKTTLVNFTPEQEEKLKRATDIIKKVVASKEFRDGVINHTWQGKKQFVDNKGFTNEEIYNRILDASESYNNDKNNALDVELELYHELNTTIGYTFPYAKRIWMNKKYFEKYTAIQVSDNLFHEWLHKLGFDHATVWSKERDYTVPYAIGYLVEKIAANLEKKSLLEKTEMSFLSTNTQKESHDSKMPKSIQAQNQ